MGLFHHNRELTLRRNETMLRGKLPSNNWRRQKIPSDVPPKVIIIFIIYLFILLFIVFGPRASCLKLWENIPRMFD